jgi:hypothetical protein
VRVVGLFRWRIECALGELDIDVLLYDERINSDGPV